MTRYFCVKNFVVPDVTELNPWDFDTSKVKFDWDDDPVRSKAAYKKAYFKNPKAEHCLFAMARGVMPKQVITASENPAAELFGIVGDYDATVGENPNQTSIGAPKSIAVVCKARRNRGLPRAIIASVTHPATRIATNAARWW